MPKTDNFTVWYDVLVIDSGILLLEWSTNDAGFALGIMMSEVVG